MRSACTIVALLLGLACTTEEPASPAPAQPEAEAPAAPRAATPPPIDPEHLAAKATPDPCAMVDATAVQTVLGLTLPPTTTRGTATGPQRSYCRYAWNDGETPRHLDVAWATALQDDRAKIAEGLALARQDLQARRSQELMVPGAVLATWSEQWLTVYANDQQVFWVIVDAAGKSPRDARNLAAAIAAHAVR